MVTYANIDPKTPTDGAPYSTAFTVPSTNADNDLFNATGEGVSSPVGLPYNQAVLAEVLLTIAGGPATNSTFVILQTDLGDGNWLDVAWVVTTSTTNGNLLFFLSGGVAGSNAIAQTRTAGAAPAANGSNQVPLGGRIRFVGRASLTGGSTPSVVVTIKYKLLGLS